MTFVFPGWRSGVPLIGASCSMVGLTPNPSDDFQINSDSEDPRIWTGSHSPVLHFRLRPIERQPCTSGKTKCVDAVIREMTARFKPLANDCHHNSVFALAYLRITEEYRRTIEDPSYFQETGWVNHYDAVFAKYYFDAYDAWSAGRRSEVPQAWLVAFDAAQNREVSGTGNLVLGINAHIQRDLPYVLAALGLVRPDGSSRKDDHNKANEFLNRANGPLLAEIARRFDPSVDDLDGPTFVDDVATFQVVPSWREPAWRQAELLVSAPNAAAPRGRGERDRGQRRHERAQPENRDRISSAARRLGAA